MSWSIPTQVEQDIIAGKAVYKTFQTGIGGQSILPVPANAYAVIFGYDFSPAGGGISINGQTGLGSYLLNFLYPFATQQISFYTGTDFYPFIHHVEVENSFAFNNAGTPFINSEVLPTTIARQVYITSSNDVTITVGLILESDVASANAIPVTNRTPQGLTYGGSGQVVATQTDFGPAVAPQQFMQPSTKDYADFAFGLLPANADGQAFATPDTTRGLVDPSAYLTSVGPAFRDIAACNYFLCLHYALYNKSVPETRG